MTLFKCPECGKEISDRAAACPHCGFPIKEALTDIDGSPSNQKAKLLPEKDIARITKDSHEQFKFVANEKSGVRIKCKGCGNIFSVQKALFKEADDTGATPVSEMSCPICAKKQTPQKDASSKKTLEETSSEKVSNYGCLLSLASIPLGIIGFIGATLAPSSLFLVLAFIATFCFCGGLIVAFFASGPVTPEDKKRAKLEAEKEKYNDLKYTCPMCGSHRIKTIGAASRMAGVFTLGLASKNLGKLYHCDDCDYSW